jgi:hypothetical protein
MTTALMSAPPPEAAARQAILQNAGYDTQEHE